MHPNPGKEMALFLLTLRSKNFWISLQESRLRTDIIKKKLYKLSPSRTAVTNSSIYIEDFTLTSAFLEISKSVIFDNNNHFLLV